MSKSALCFKLSFLLIIIAEIHAHKVNTIYDFFLFRFTLRLALGLWLVMLGEELNSLSNDVIFNFTLLAPSMLILS
jgi:hypothetical protein